MKTLIKNGYLITMEEESVQKDGYVIIEDETILATGSGVPPADEYDKVIDADEAIILPGFINTHTHVGMGLFRGYADDLPLMEWLETKIFPMEDQLNDEYLYHGAMLDILEMIQSGTTCFLSMYMFNNGAAKAILESGIRAVLGRGTSGIGPDEKHRQVFDEIRDLYRRCHGADNDRLRIWIGPHACYVCPPDYLKKVAALAEELHTGVTIHIAETQSEVDGCLKNYGLRPLPYIEQSGIFDHPTVAAHCVWMNEEELAILKKYQVGVAYNPESNMKLGSGVAPIGKMLQMGIHVGLGTDGSSSNNDLNMIGEMRSAAFLQKVANLDPLALSAWDVLRMATVEGAKILHWEDAIGQLKPGYQADLILIRTKCPHMRPLHDVVSNLVYSADKSDVETVMVKGRILMENRRMTGLHETEIIAQAERTFREMYKKLQQSQKKEDEKVDI